MPKRNKDLSSRAESTGGAMVAPACACGSCRTCALKSADDFCSRASIEIQEIDAKQDFLRALIEQARQSKALRQRIVSEVGYLPAGDLDAAEARARQRLKELGEQRAAIMAEVCRRCDPAQCERA